MGKTWFIPFSSISTQYMLFITSYRKKHSVYRVWYYLQFQISTRDLGVDTPWIKGWLLSMHFCLGWTVLRTQLVKVLAAQSFELFVTLWTVPCQALCLWNSPGKNTGVGSIPFSRGSSQLRDWTRVSCIAGRFFTIWVTREALYNWANNDGSIKSISLEFKEDKQQQSHK